MSGSRRAHERVVLARYADPEGHPHRVVIRARLVLDVAAGRRPRVVARLSEGEGETQARALLEGSRIDEGYLARAARERRPFIRALTIDDMRPRAEAQDGAEADGQAHDRAADEPPLAA
jgi:hypothetical protein